MSGYGETFVLTGCASGIGLCLADVLVARGDRVIATDVDLGALSAHVEAASWPAERAMVRELDVRDPTAWAAVLDEAVATFGRLDVLVNNAGYIKPGWFLDSTAEEISRQIDVNTKGVMFGTHAAARIMVPQRRGHIINVGSFAALGPIPGIAVYCGSKYAVRGFSLAAAQELRPFGVHVTVVSPESVQTAMLDVEARHNASAIVFSAPKLLTVDDVARNIVARVLDRKRKPLEVRIPAWRGRMARLLDLLPRMGARLAVPRLRRRGLARQQEIRAQTDADAGDRDGSRQSAP